MAEGRGERAQPIFRGADESTVLTDISGRNRGMLETNAWETKSERLRSLASYVSPHGGMASPTSNLALIPNEAHARHHLRQEPDV